DAEVDRLDGVSRHECEESERPAELDLEAERVLEQHLEAQQQQHDPGDVRGDLVEPEAAPDLRKRLGTRSKNHGCHPTVAVSGDSSASAASSTSRSQASRTSRYQRYTAKIANRAHSMA